MCTAAIVVLIAVTGGTQATTPPARAEIPPHLGYGINVRQESNVDPLVAPLGFEWVKLWEEYEGDPPAERLPYQVMFVIECNGMAANLDTWGDHVEAIATAGLGFVEAYEIGNEPNVERFWGGASPDPREYFWMLKVAYERIKAVDPAAIVVSAGLAPVGRVQGGCNGLNGNDCHAMDEREFARVMLLWGAGNYFDAFGYHPYGFAYAPETDPHSVSNGFAFRGAEVMHDLLEEYDLGHKPIWATEFNWLREWEGSPPPSDCSSEYEANFGWMEVSEAYQADYLTRAFQYADANWPWMGVMFVWNLDWHNYHHVGYCEAARFFSIRKGTDSLGSPALAYDALAGMEKRVGHFGPRLAITPSALTFLVDVDEPAVYTTTLLPSNTGYRVLTWAATAETGLPVTPTLPITTGLQGAPLTVTVNTTGYLTGTFTGALTVTATTTDVLDTPQTVPVTLLVVPEVYRAYLPLTFHSAP